MCRILKLDRVIQALTDTRVHWYRLPLGLPISIYINYSEIYIREGVTLAQLVKSSVGQADVQRFETRLGHNWLSCGVFLVKSRHFGLPLAQTIRPNWQSLLAGGSVAIQTWSIYKVYT